MRRICFVTIIVLFAPLARANGPTTRPALQTWRIDNPAIRESSGIVASRRFGDVSWTHNDSGNTPLIFAITPEGKSIAQFVVQAINFDWEDIAIDDDGHLYIADVGRNHGKRKFPMVYQIDEPDPHAGDPAQPLRVRQYWQLKFPGQEFDCESLVIHDGHGYVISKYLDGRAAEVFRFALTPQKHPVLLEKVATLPIKAPVTAADISPDGQRLAVMTIVGPYVFDIAGDITAAEKSKPAHITYVHFSMEGICFAPEGLMATTETRDLLLFGLESPADDPAPAP